MNIDKQSILTTEDRFKILDLYFKKDNILVRHHLDSYDIFITRIKKLMVSSKNIIATKMTEKQKITHYFKFSNIKFACPTDTKGNYITPSIARINSLTYDCTIIVDITQYQETYDLSTKKKYIKTIGVKDDFVLTKIPLMVNSGYCNINKICNSECIYDGGGYFVLDGTEYILVPFEELVDNKPLVFMKKESNIKYSVVQLNSRSQNIEEMRQIINIRMKSTDHIILRAPIIRDVSVFIVLRALGISSDKDIIDLIVEDNDDWEMINLLKTSLNNCKTDDGIRIQNHTMALNFLIKKVKVEVQFTETNIELKTQQRIEHLKLLLKNSFIPHITKNHYCKGLYICLMIRKLLLVWLKRRPYDERDSYENKRIEMPGTIMFEMFKKNYKILLSECGKFIDKSDKEKEQTTIIDRIKTSIIETGIKRSMKKDDYGGRTGVCQIVQRGSLLNTIALQTRVDAQIKNKQSSSKLLQTRYGHGTQLFLICFAQTPENDKAGLVKHLTMLTKLTLETDEQTRIIHDLMIKHITQLKMIKIVDIKNSVKVFLNGEWLGIINNDKAETFYDMMRQKKLKGEIDIYTSIVFDIRSEFETDEIHVWCDEGRLVTLLMCVNDNKINMSKKKIYEITKILDSKNDSIETFIKSNPGLLEFLGADELHHSIVSIKPETVWAEREKQLNSKKEILKIKGKIDVRQLKNRYNDLSYVNYSYCLIHPSVTLGAVANAIPYPQCNQSPRVIYGFSQIKHGMCIYSSNYRERTDNSFILYHPSRPLVNTRTMKYIHMDKMPFGENSIVALMAYSGFNQEDSIILNGSAIEAGFMRSMSLSKYSDKINKNKSTGENDEFTKPDRNKVIQFKSFNYSKLNEKGYVPKETPINDGDIIMGKITPLQEPIDGKKFKDASTVYKAGEKGVVERVWVDIKNSEGYNIIKMTIRSDRTPAVGDKMCSRSGQKGIVGAIFRQVDMPFTEDGIYPDIIITPNSIPSRMTLSQLYESLFAKYGAARGCTIDGTSFEPICFNEITKKLEDMGIDSSGKETLVNGMTGATITNKIYIGPTYYLRLKHLVNDKIHARARGPLTSLTRQPLEGRARDGGLRFGEMERDCMIAHGMSRFLKEKTVDVSDKFYIHVCQTCGLFAQRQRKLNGNGNTNYSSSDDIYICVKCENKAEIYRTTIPYAFKLLIQELMALNIEPKISFK